MIEWKKNELDSLTSHKILQGVREEQEIGCIFN